mmetsp:Transcript_49881/g.114017  ORF Transcript_49881/g.114017 Transcript_49881/m.114017 type:complete len:98 (-) Transcript_49881:127-420(-)
MEVLGASSGTSTQDMNRWFDIITSGPSCPENMQQHLCGVGWKAITGTTMHGGRQFQTGLKQAMAAAVKPLLWLRCWSICMQKARAVVTTLRTSSLLE